MPHQISRNSPAHQVLLTDVHTSSEDTIELRIVAAIGHRPGSTGTDAVLPGILAAVPDHPDRAGVYLADRSNDASPLRRLDDLAVTVTEDHVSTLRLRTLSGEPLLAPIIRAAEHIHLLIVLGYVDSPAHPHHYLSPCSDLSSMVMVIFGGH